MEMAPEARPSARADLAWSAFWLALGGLIVVESWRMDRLEKLNINPYTVPGLVPGLLGAMILVLAVALALRSLRRDDVQSVSDEAHWGRFALAGALFVIYALGLVSRVPYWLATFVFVAGFIAIFQRRIVFALVAGACTSAAVTFLFQSVFLVRLP
jgi:uncharacterized MnhB-related membrane protein